MPRAAARRSPTFELLPGVVEACRPSPTPGWPLVVVTNQPDLARGALDPAELERDARRGCAPSCRSTTSCVCPHDDADGCACRKPRPGMILDAARRLGLDLDRSVVVGDRWRDIEAAHRAGVRVRLDRLGATANRSGTRRTHVVGSLPRRGIMS